MSTSITYSWSSGGNPLDRIKILDSVGTWADKQGPSVREALKSETPVYQKPPNDPRPRPGGRLRRNTRYERSIDGVSVTLSFNSYTPYTRYVIDGTAGHAIKARAARRLLYYNIAGPHMPKEIWHPGTAPNNYPRRVLDARRDALRRSLLQQIRSDIGGT